MKFRNLAHWIDVNRKMTSTLYINTYWHLPIYSFICGGNSQQRRRLCFAPLLRTKCVLVCVGRTYFSAGSLPLSHFSEISSSSLNVVRWTWTARRNRTLFWNKNISNVLLLCYLKMSLNRVRCSVQLSLLLFMAYILRTTNEEKKN